MNKKKKRKRKNYSKKILPNYGGQIWRETAQNLRLGVFPWRGKKLKLVWGYFWNLCSRMCTCAPKCRSVPQVFIFNIILDSYWFQASWMLTKDSDPFTYLSRLYILSERKTHHIKTDHHWTYLWKQTSHTFHQNIFEQA